MLERCGIGMCHFDEEDIYGDFFPVDDNEVFSDYDGRRMSCSFTGHRQIAKEEEYGIMLKLRATIQYLVSQGVKDFHAGGAVGFDTLAAIAVLQVKNEHDDVRLILDLPYEKQLSEKWSDKQKRQYKMVLENADVVNIHSKRYSDYEAARQALLKRDRILVENSYYCVCYLRPGTDRGGTLYTVNYAKRGNTHIINLAE